jgi:hypothetical protein
LTDPRERPVRAWWKIGPVRASRRPPGVNVYIAKDGARAVLAPLAANADGLYLEQPGQARRLDAPDATALGEAFLTAWDAFREDATADARRPRSAWPAFEASGARSVMAFEAGFLPVACFALDPSGAVVRASTPHPTEGGIALSIAFNPRSPAAEVGAQLLRLSTVARGDAAGS